MTAPLRHTIQGSLAAARTTLRTPATWWILGLTTLAMATTSGIQFRASTDTAGIQGELCFAAAFLATVLVGLQAQPLVLDPQRWFGVSLRRPGRLQDWSLDLACVLGVVLGAGAGLAVGLFLTLLLQPAPMGILGPVTLASASLGWVAATSTLLVVYALAGALPRVPVLFLGVLWTFLNLVPEVAPSVLRPLLFPIESSHFALDAAGTVPVRATWFVSAVVHLLAWAVLWALPHCVPWPALGPASRRSAS